MCSKMEKMRVIIMALFLYIGIAVAGVADIGKAENPAEDADVGVLSEAILKTLVTHCTSHVAKTCTTSASEPLQSPNGFALCLFVSMEKCLANNIQHKTKTKSAQELFKPPETPGGGSLVDGGGIPPSAPSPPLAPSSFTNSLIEGIKFQTILRTCTHLTAKTCFTAPRVATQLLEACLVPSMNQCLYPHAHEPAGGSPLTRK